MTRRTLGRPAFCDLGYVIFRGDKPPMPPSDRVECEQNFNLRQLIACEELAFDCQSTSLVIGQQDPLPSEFLFENDILGAKLLDDFLLLSIDPSGKHDQHPLPRLQIEVHRRLGNLANPRQLLVCSKM